MPNHMTRVGEGRAIVNCTFDIDSDGDVENLKVELEGVNIFDSLTEDQVNDLEAECYAAYVAEAKEQADDYKIEAYEENKRTV
jgi:hypothetical protein